MIYIYLLLVFVRLVVAPVPNFHDLNVHEDLPHQDLQDLTFFSQVIDLEDWDPNRSLRYKRNVKRDIDNNEQLPLISNSTFLVQGGRGGDKGIKPKWHVGAGLFLNKEKYGSADKTLVRYMCDGDKEEEEEDCSCDEEWSSDDDGGSKLKWFKPFSVPTNETRDISIISSSKIVSTNNDGTFFSDTENTQGSFHNVSSSVNSLSMESGGVSVSFSCIFFVIYFFLQL